MARVKIIFPEKQSSFSTEIPVLIQHINYGGHLGNDSILSVIHEARIQYFKHLGCSETNAFGSGLIMTDAAIIYRGEGFQGDVLQVSIVAGDLSSRGFDLYYRLDGKRDGMIKPIAEAKTGMLCFDYTTRKPARMSEMLRKKLLQ